MPLCASVFLGQPEGDKKRHKTVEVSLAVPLALEERLPWLLAIALANIPHPDREQSQQPQAQ